MINNPPENQSEESTMNKQERINRIRNNQKRINAKQERGRGQSRKQIERKKKGSKFLIKALIGGSATGLIGGGTWFIFS